MKLALLDMEHIKNEYRETEMILLKPVILIMLAIYIPWFFAFKYGVGQNIRAILFIWTIIVLLYGFRELMVWRLNAYVLTNKRLVRFSHDGIFKRTVVETPLERILNVSYKTTGVMSALFGFGDVEVQVIGLVEPVILRRIKHPAKIKDYLWQMHQRSVQDHDEWQSKNIPHLQEKVGYTKQNQRIL